MDAPPNGDSESVSRGGEGRGEGQVGELGLGRPGTSFSHLSSSSSRSELSALHAKNRT